MRLAFLSLLAACALLAGCSDSPDDELNRWMAQQRAEVKPKIEEIPEPKAYTPQKYSEEAAADPFARDKLTLALRRESGQANNNAALLTPELARRKEPLESVPLDNMAMVGSLLKRAGGVASERELGEALVELVTDPVKRARLGAAARALVEANRGAKDKTLAVIAELLPADGRTVVLPFRLVH